ncbi:hypothetical protein K491DRAFT_696578 [Lophiostoma macrostomum CBS 122681]|uniref:HD domain-containing protein n=1 Tax=Lophiostoma macrostomum CBS 122681 TaxID=1314788 RepID=A0A6A6SUS5_9PLEO|nr:hypothetical protein K491DRAFT_696578 [Lophiostoma macrostomum CBS 122681]
MLLPYFILLPLALSLPAPTPPLQNTTQVIAGITVPSTPLITKALTYARANTDDPTYNHVIRTWLNVMASVSHLPTSITQDLDLEALTIAALLHDMGWSNNSALISRSTRFEVNGADVARAFLLREGGDAWDSHRIQLVWDAIALHSTSDIYPYKQGEVTFTGLGAAEDIMGPNATAQAYGSEKVGVTQEEWERFNAAYPRLGLKTYINGVFTWLCTNKPQTTFNNFVGDWGEESVEGYERERKGKREIDVIEQFAVQ